MDRKLLENLSSSLTKLVARERDALLLRVKENESEFRAEQEKQVVRIEALQAVLDRVIAEIDRARESNKEFQSSIKEQSDSNQEDVAKSFIEFTDYVEGKIAELSVDNNKSVDSLSDRFDQLEKELIELAARELPDFTEDAAALSKRIDGFIGEHSRALKRVAENIVTLDDKIAAIPVYDDSEIKSDFYKELGTLRETFGEALKGRVTTADLNAQVEQAHAALLETIDGYNRGFHEKIKEVSAEVQNLGGLVDSIQPYDDAVIKAELAEARVHLSEFRQVFDSIPSEYNDSEIKQALKQLEVELVAKVDDHTARFDDVHTRLDGHGANLKAHRDAVRKELSIANKYVDDINKDIKDEIGFTRQLSADVDKRIEGMQQQHDANRGAIQDVELVVHERYQETVEALQKLAEETSAEIGGLSNRILDKYAKVELWQRGGAAYKEYSFVRWNGGLWQSSCSTHAEPGTNEDYILLVNGVKDVSAEVVDGSDPTISFNVELTSGKLASTELKLPKHVYKGTFNKGEEYVAGDVFMKDGSTWLVLNKDVFWEPYDNPNCMLLAMRGAKGSRGKQGERGPVGPPVDRDSVVKLINQVLEDGEGIPFKAYRGMWQPNTPYQRGDVVSVQHGLWIAESNAENGVSPVAIMEARNWRPMLTVTAAGVVSFPNGVPIAPYDPGLEYQPMDLVTYFAKRTDGIVGRDNYHILYQNRTGGTIGPVPWDLANWTEIGFLETDIEAVIRAYDATRGYRIDEKVIHDISSSDSTPIIYMALNDNPPKPWDWGDVGTLWQPLSSQSEGEAGSRIEYWQPDTEYPDGAVVTAIDPAAPVRDWVQLWRNEQGIPIEGTSEFYAPSWQLIGTKKQDAEYSILDYDDAATYPQDDKVVHESSPGAGDNVIWRCTNVSKPPGSWNPVDWEPLSIVDHENLLNRSSPDQHSIGAITGLTQELLEAENHRNDPSIHFYDAPVSNAGFIRRNNDWIFATNIAALMGQPNSATLGTGGFDLVGWDAELEHGLMGDNADPATGIIDIPEDSFYRIGAHVFGTQGNSTKEESMWLEFEIIGGGNAGIYSISHLEIGTDKTSDRSLSANLTFQLLSVNSLRLRLRASAGLGTFTFTYCSFEVLKLV